MFLLWTLGVDVLAHYIRQCNVSGFMLQFYASLMVSQQATIEFEFTRTVLLIIQLTRCLILHLEQLACE